MISLSLNKVARDLFGDAVSSVRVCFKDDELLILPSNRTKGIGNFSKNERMVPLVRSATGMKFSIPMSGVDIGSSFVIEELKYGWTKFTVAASNIGRGTPTAKVVAK